jgi:hypothetical protein
VFHLSAGDFFGVLQLFARAGTGAGVDTGEPTQEKETHTLEADSPEECDAWDVWVEELKSVRELVRNVWTAAETVPV